MKMKPSSSGIGTVATDDSDVATTDCQGTAPMTNGTTYGRHPNDHNEEKDQWGRHHPTVVTSIPTAPTAKTTTASHRWRQLLTEFGPKLILEVMGAAGAVWGFSEIVGLRTPATLWFWRPCAETVGVVFFVRYLHQLASAWKTTHGRDHRSHNYEDNHNINNKHHDLELGMEMSPSTCSRDRKSVV